MKSNPSRPGAPARQAASRPAGNRPAANRPSMTPAQRAANAQRVSESLRGVITEMRRVTWPTREEWIAATLLTIALVVGVGVFTFAADWVFGQVFGLLTGGTR